MDKIMVVMRFFKTFLMRIINIFRLRKVVHEKTYYPEVKRKNIFQRYFDNFLWTIKYGEINRFYNLYGFDVKLNKNKNEYIDYLSFMRKGVFCIKNYDEFNQNKNNFLKGIYIIQNRVIQHEKMNKLNSYSVNTIRIVTVRTNNNIEVLCSGVRIGTKTSNYVDNWAKGGVYVEVNKTGKLAKYGFAKPKYGGKFEVHPDNNVKFLGYQLPKYDEVVKLVKKAHFSLYGIHSIGWDVAICEDGPILIEGNDNWEISFMQVNHGLKHEWKKSLR